MTQLTTEGRSASRPADGDDTIDVEGAQAGEIVEVKILPAGANGLRAELVRDAA